jgi:hypothetical protein
VKLNALDWVVIGAVTVSLICLAWRAFSSPENPTPDEK